MSGSTRPVVLVALLVVMLAMAVALQATPAVMAPVIALALVVLFLVGREIGASRKP